MPPKNLTRTRVRMEGDTVRLEMVQKSGHVLLADLQRRQWGGSGV